MIVAGIGQCSWDYIVLVDNYPPADTKKEALQWQEQGGGPVATALVALSRLGIPCRFAGITGNDEAGGKIDASLGREGIDVRWIRKREGASSQVAFIVVEKETAKRTIFWKRPTGSPMQPEETGDGFLGKCNFLLLDGLMAEASLAAAEMARAQNIPVMLDAGRVRPGMLELARLCDYVVASEEFAKDLGLTPDPREVQKKRQELGVRILTITLGERGSITASGDEPFHFPSFRVDAVDTTGAGDVFHGGYVFGLLQGWSLRDTVAFASAMAALKCREIGGRQGIQGISGVMKFLAEQGYDIETRV